MAKITKEMALRYHEQGKPGKIEVVPTKPYTTQTDLSLAYSPGVAEPCLEIEKNPDDAYRYTAKGNLVAVISNGTAVLGLGDIGALAGKPVMEGKGLLFKIYSGIDVFDIEINEKDPEKFIQAVKAIAPTFGGINLEDIKAPECFEIERRLKEYDVKIVRNTDYASGVLSSARLGLSMMPADVAGAVVLPADMPAFTEEYIDGLIDGFDPAGGKKLCLPVFNKVRYNPVLWARDLFAAFKIVPEDSYWSPVLIEHSDYMYELELDDAFPVSDINTQGDWSAFCDEVDFETAAELDLEALERNLNKTSKD